jgi:hypothetical protein
MRDASEIKDRFRKIMRRLNVKQTQIDECIQRSMFAISGQPQNPALRPGELLLLQLVKDEARRLDKLRSRIEYALVFDRLVPDPTGAISRRHWPRAGREWPWIVYGSETIPTIPFSLESLGLAESYDGQTNPRTITPQDEAVIQPYIPWAPPANGVTTCLSGRRAPRAATGKPVLTAIYNFDKIAAARGTRLPKTTKRTGQQYVRNQALADGLKLYYRNRCQICLQDFTTSYGVSFAEAHHIQYLRNSGPDVSQNLIVICPNHHSLIHATNAVFDRSNLSYTYPNGLVEKLQLRDHFDNATAVALSLI